MDKAPDSPLVASGTPAPAAAPAEAAEQAIDAAGMLGLLIGSAAIIVTLMGVLIPVVPWILAGVLGAATLACGLISRNPARRWIIGAGIIAIIPITLFVVVQSLPKLMG